MDMETKTYNIVLCYKVTIKYKKGQFSPGRQ